MPGCTLMRIYLESTIPSYVVARPALMENDHESDE